MTKISIFLGVIVILGIFLKLEIDKQREFLLNAPSLEITPKKIDLGTISATKGKVETSFVLENVGKNDLKIMQITTSCMCTEAYFIYKGKESPPFGMHNNVPGWSGKIPPGESAELKVVYDPNFHANTRGEVTRFVTFNTNDPNKKQATVKIRAFVVT
jgi:hypothetical protein